MTKDEIMALTARDWQLFNMRGSDRVALQLNKALIKAVSRRVSGFEVQEAAAQVGRTMIGLMWKKSRYGATDTEAEVLLQTLLTRIYGSLAANVIR